MKILKDKCDARMGGYFSNAKKTALKNMPFGEAAARLKDKCDGRINFGETASASGHLAVGAAAKGAVGGNVVGGGVEMFATVKLVTDKYEGLGLRLGEVGSVVEIYTKPVLGYEVEFHDVSYDNNYRVKSISADDIELV